MGDIGQDGDFDALMSFYSHFRGAKNHTSKNNLNLKFFSELLSRLTRVNGENFKLELLFLNIFKIFRKSEKIKKQKISFFSPFTRVSVLNNLLKIFKFKLFLEV